MAPILSQMNPVYIATSYLSKIHFSIILPTTSRSSLLEQAYKTLERRILGALKKAVDTTSIWGVKKRAREVNPVLDDAAADGTSSIHHISKCFRRKYCFRKAKIFHGLLMFLLNTKYILTHC
jgi:hypothetical protein